MNDKASFKHWAFFDKIISFESFIANRYLNIITVAFCLANPNAAVFFLLNHLFLIVIYSECLLRKGR